jgi:hypothetical protein
MSVRMKVGGKVARSLFSMGNRTKVVVIFFALLGLTSVILVFPLSDDKVEINTIERIEISYQAVYYMGEAEKHYIIENRNGEYYSDTGEKIDSTLIDNMVESLCGLYESSEYESDTCMTDFYPQFTVVITHTKGNIVLRSTSNCHCFMP